MEWIVIIIAAAGASMLTFFSGFGLGTILMPVFALFFPVDLAIAMTAVVHFLNNIFKTGLIGRSAVASIVLQFGIPALLFAALGALSLDFLSNFPIHVQYRLAGMSLATNVLNLVIGLLLIAFAIVEVIPRRSRKRPGTVGLMAGGALSGFFGGLSGHQGALRSGFLIRMGLNKREFVATGILISLFVDVSRLGVYSNTIGFSAVADQKWIILVAVLSAFGGAIIGKKLLKKVTLKAVHIVVAGGIILIGLFMALGTL